MDKAKSKHPPTAMSDERPTIQPRRLRRLLQRLIDIYSPTGKEREILEFLHGYLKRRGVPVVRQPVDEYRYNLIVMPRETHVALALIGHVDTIGAYDLEHYGYDAQGDRILGLGACDMKGGCAAMVEGFLSSWEQSGGSVPASLVLLVGEEEEGDGVRELIKDFHFPWAIVGEPTNLRPSLSHYGYLEAQICTTGRRIHASLANKRQNPIASMLRLILQITGYLETKRPEAVYNVRDLFSSQAGFSVPHRCEAWLDIHVPPAAPLGQIIMDIEDLFHQRRKKDPRQDATLRFLTVDAGYSLPERGPVVTALQTVYAAHALPWQPEAFRSHSDANQLWEAGVMPLLLGPGELENAHAPDESVSFRQVCLAAELYLNLLMQLMVQGP
jgi:acetylornithine deacetylase